MTTQSTIGRRPAKNALFDGFAAVAGAMANGRRAEIIELLAQGERSVEHVADAIDQSVANTSHHLRRLARAGLVSTRRDGTRIYYRLTDETRIRLMGRVARCHNRDISTTSTNSPTPISETAPRSQPLRAANSKSGYNATRRPSSTCGPEPSTTPDTSPEPSPSRPTISTNCCPRCPRIGRSSPTAEGPTAYTPTRLCVRSSLKDEPPDGSKTVTPNGNGAVAPSRRASSPPADRVPVIPGARDIIGVPKTDQIDTRRIPMSLRINDVAPDFTAETTQGTISFHEWIGDGWALMFSHPKDFTPVCTTELGLLAGLKAEFDKRGCQIIGISVDGVSDHEAWSDDIKTSQGHTVTYPLIGDPSLEVVKLYDMLPADAGDTSEGRTPADNATARSVFIIGPDKRIKASLTYPMSTGRNFTEILRLLDSWPAHRQGKGGHSSQLGTGRRRDHPALGLRR